MFGFRRKNGMEDSTGMRDRTSEDEAIGMNILRFLRTECISMDLAARPSEPGADETDEQRERRLIADKERVLQEIADILDRSGQIVNPTKFYKDLLNRERKATTAIAPGIAIPHVRSKQARSFIMGFARSKGGLPFGSLDGGPTHLFFLLASPSHEDQDFDKVYLRVYRQFAEMVRHEWIVDSFMDAEDEQDILNILRGYILQ